MKYIERERRGLEACSPYEYGINGLRGFGEILRLAALFKNWNTIGYVAMGLRLRDT